LSPAGDPRTDEELLAIVAAFVLRARRVLAHSLCADEAALLALADGAWIAIRKEGVESLQRRLPNEESLESLAARVRPLTLQDDGIHYNQVLNALSALLVRHGHPQEAEWCRNLKKDWKSVDIKGGEPGYVVSQATPGSEEPATELTDVALANAWFYGDLVHADQTQIEAAEVFPIDNRFAAAAVRTAQLAIMARDTLSYIWSLVDDSLISLTREVLEVVPVKVEPKELQMTGFYTAPAGTPIPGPAGQDLDASWKTAALPGTEDGQWFMRIPWGRSD
jgi:hypothetical protein